MSSSFPVACFVDDGTMVVDHDLCLYGMHFPLSRVVCLSSSPVFRPWCLLFSVQSVKDRKPGKCLSASSGVCSLFVTCCHLFWGWHALSYKRPYLLDVPADAALVQAKEKASKSVGYAKTVVHQKHQKPVFYVQLEMPACPYRPFSFLSFC